MNKSYRIVWNKARNCLMVVAEFASSQGKGKSVGGAVIGAVAAAVLALGSAGEASATSSNTTVNLTTGQNLSVGPNEAITVSGADAIDGNNVTANSISVSGTVSGTTSGIFLVQTTLTGGISNTQSVSAGVTYTGTVSGSLLGIQLLGSQVQGDIVNAARIYGSSAALAVLTGSTLNGALLNAGTIAAANGNGKAVFVKSSAINGGINNSGLIVGGSAIRLDNTNPAVAINNTGRIVSDNIAITVGTSSATLNNAATGTVVGSLLGNLDVSNSGLVALQTYNQISGTVTPNSVVHATIVGNYVQSPTGVLQVGIASGANYSTLSVSGSATLTNSKLRVNGTSTGTATINDVVSATSLAANGLTVVGNSAGATYSYSILANSLSLTQTAVSVCGTLTTAYNGTCRVAFDNPTLAINGAGNLTTTNDRGVIALYGNYSGQINNGQLNLAGGTVSAARTGIYYTSAAILSGGLLNRGLIIGETVAGVFVDHASLASNISNAGTITGGEVGLLLSGASVSGITNTGLIEGQSGAGISFVASTAAGINNTGVVAGNTAGVKLQNATIAGALNNVGVIRATVGAGASISGNVAINGGLNNTGSILGQTGISLASASFTGAVTNAGLIEGSASGVLIANASTANVINNTGTIVGGGAALSLSGVVALNTFNNAGELSGQTGIGLNNANVNGTINNTNLITAASTGLSIENSTFAGTFSNTGIVSAQSGIFLANSTITGSISNDGQVIGSRAGLSIVDGLNVAGTFINNGTLSGAVNAISLANATVVGAITNAGLIYATSNNAITASGGTNSTIVNAAGGTIIGAIDGAINISNSGVVSLTSFGGTIGSHLAANVNGNFSQGASGLLVMGVDGVSGSGTVSGNFSTLAAGGAVNLDNSVIRVNQNRGNAVLQGQTLASFITGSSISTSNLSIVDNIKSINYTFTGSGGALSLVAVAAGANCTTPLNTLFNGSCQVTGANPNLIIGSAGTVSATTEQQGIYVIGNAGQIVNQGTVSANQTGIFFTSGASLSAGLTNTGLIQATATGYGILMTASGMAGLQNLGGTISGVQAGIQLSYSTLTGGLTNTGSIGGGVGLLFANSFVSGGLNNSGYMNEISISRSTVVGSILNSSIGTVSGYYSYQSELIGDVSNSGLLSNRVLFRQSTISGNFVQSANLGTPSTHAQSGLIFDRSKVTGSIINSGTVSTPQSFYGTGIALHSAVVDGSVINIGQLDAFYGRGISIGGSYIGGGLTNTGSVFSSELTVQLSNSTISSGIFNSGHINSGFQIRSNSLVQGGFTNTGNLGSYNASSLAVLTGSSIAGGFLNTAGASLVGSLDVRSSFINGGLTNQGFVGGVYFGSQWGAQGSSTLTGGLTNSGVIYGSSYALLVNASEIGGGIRNTGSIIAGSGNGQAAVFLTNTSLTGGVVNTGLIGSASYGIKSVGSSVTDGISNNLGTIVGAGNFFGSGGIGISFSNGVLVGGITNTGLVQGGATSGVGMQFVNTTVSDGIQNAGDIVAFSGIKFAGTNFTGGITNTGLLAALGGVAVAATGLPTTQTVTNAQTGQIIGAVNGNFDVSNSGLLALQTLSAVGGSITPGSHVNASIDGNYVQSGSGVLRIGVAGSAGTGAISGNYSQLSVGGLASLASGGQIMVYSNNINAVTSTGVLNVVLTSAASALTVSGLTILDNTPLVSYEWITTAGTLQLVAYNTGACGTVSGQINAPCEIANLSVSGNDYTYINVANNGSIVPSLIAHLVGAPGINVLSGGVINGFINNAGLVSSNNTGVLFNTGSSLSGGITNTGVITGASVAGLIMRTASLQGGLSNTGGTISGMQTGISLLGSSITGGMVNSGLIQGSLAGVLMSGGFYSTLTNQTGGAIVGVTGSGLSVLAGATLTGLSNAGYISSINNAGQIGSLATGINFNQGTLSGGVSNSGLISGTAYGIYITQSSLSGGIANTGSIGGGFFGVALLSQTNVNDGLTNSGSISGNLHGIYLTGSTTLSGGLLNSGSIAGRTAVQIVSVSQLSGGLTNSGLISGVNYGVNVTSNLVGGIHNLNGGTLTGNVALQVINTSLDVTNAGLIYGTSGVAVTASGVTIGLQNNTAGTIVGAINGTVDVSNSGLIALQTAYNGTTYAGSPVAATITGNFAQASSGTLQVAVTGVSGSGTTSGNYSQLNVSSTASFAANSNLSIVMSSGAAVIGGQTLAGVVSAGSVTTSGFTITDNSALVDFRYVTTAGSISLVATTVINCGSLVGTYQLGPCQVGVGIPSLTVTGLGTISGGTQGINVLAANLTGRIINQGTVQGTATGIRFLGGATLSGGITNSGLITGAAGVVYSSGVSGSVLRNLATGSIVGTNGAGVSINSGALLGSVNNAGSIDSLVVSGLVGNGVTNSGLLGTASGNIALGVFGSGTLSGGFNNTGTVNAYYGVEVASNALLQGGITNSGLIAGGATNRGIAIDSNGTVGGTITGGLRNSGQITGRTGVLVSNGLLDGGITNSGSIVGGSGTITGYGVLVAGGTIGGINNTTGGYISSIYNAGQVGNSGALFGIALSGSSIGAGITNSGLITAMNTAARATGLSLNGGATLTGGISNSGRIEANYSGIRVNGSELIGNLVNSGVINGVSQAGVAIVNAQLDGQILNQSGGTLSGRTGGLYVYNGSISGAIANAGTVSGGRNGVSLILSQIASISNAGLIRGLTTGVRVEDSTILTGITNSGLITSTATSGRATGLLLTGAGTTVTGNISNTGVIQGNYVGLRVYGASSLVGDVVNSGVMNGTSSAGVEVHTSTIDGNVINLAGGTLSGGNAGIGMYSGTIVGRINNAGTITGANRGVSVYGNSQIASLTNTGLISGSAEGGIVVDSASRIVGSIQNYGSVVGAAGILYATGAAGGVLNNTGFIVGTSGAGVSVAGGTTLLALQNSGAISSLNNAGTIGSSTASLRLNQNSSIGNVVNTGLIASAGTVAGIKATNSTISSLLNNGGSIGGVQLEYYARINNGLVNNGGTISGALPIELRSSSYLVGGLTNSGFINSSAGNAIALIYDSTITGGIYNSGSISSSAGGAISIDSSSLVDLISNTGYISSINNAGSMSSLVFSGGDADYILNTGTITAAANQAIALNAGSSVTGGITNSGILTGSAGAGVLVGASYAQSFVNAASGTISGLLNGVNLNLGAIVGSNVNNAGLIQGTSVAGLRVAASTILGAINNTGSMVGSGTGTSTGLLIVTGSTVTSGVTNAGLIGGAIGVRVHNSSVSNIQNMGLITGSSGVAVTVSGTSVTLVNNAAGTVVGAVNGLLDVSNSGLLALQSAYNGMTYAGNVVAATITGNFVQAASGTLQIGVNGTTGTGTIGGNYSTLSVSGTADFAANSNLNVVMSASTSVQLGQTLAGVVNAGSLMSNAFTILDNSAVVEFTWQTIGGMLNLVAVAAPVICGATVSTGQQGPCEIDVSNYPDLTVTSLGSISGGLQGVRVLTGAITGRLSNAGSILGTNTGVQFRSNASLSGGITNTGLIQGAAGILYAAGASGGVLNNSGSIIGTSGAGVSVAGGATLNTIRNTGYISSIDNVGSVIGQSFGVDLSNGSISSGITNSGLISASSTAIRLLNSTVNGGIRNSGSIIGSSTGIYIVSSILTGGISNTGTILSPNTALGVVGSTVSGLFNQGYIGKVFNDGSIGGVVNTGYIASFINTGRINASGAALLITAGGLIASGLTNSGSIRGETRGVAVSRATLSGGLTNSGLITGTSSTGIAFSVSALTGDLRNLAGASIAGLDRGVTFYQSTASGTISNAGVISAVNNEGLYINASTVSAIANSGSITGRSAGVLLDNSALLGTFVNSGTIAGVFNGLNVHNSTLNGTLANNGFINAPNGKGIQLYLSDLVSLSNTGTIVSQSAGILLAGGNTIAGAIYNSGLINSSFAQSGIQNNSSEVDSIVNEGTVYGTNAISLSAGRVINGVTNSGVLNGASVGLFVTAGGTLSGGITNLAGGSIVGLVGVQVVSSSLNGGISNSGLIRGASGIAVAVSGTPVTLANNTAGTIVGAVNGLLDVSNSGLLALQTAYNGTTFVGSPVAATITGNYVQAASGTLQIGVNGTTGTGTIGGNYSTMSVSGTADFVANSRLSVVMSSADSVVNGQTLAGVVTAGSLTTNGFSISDNSALIGFRYQTVSGSLNLVAYNTPNCGSVVGGYQVGACEVGIGIPSLTVTGLGTIAGGTQGINVLAANLTGRIINQGTVQGNVTGIQFVAGGTLSSGITNTGLIQGLTAHGIAMVQASLGGGIANTGGTISGLQNGLMLSGSTLSAGITNTGLIAGTSFAGVMLTNSGLVAASGGLYNAASGTITGAPNGVYMGNSDATGGFTNAGLILGSAIGGQFQRALSLYQSTLSGGILNTGRIEGDESAISLEESTVAGGIVNTNALAGSLKLQARSLITGGFANTGLMSGATGIYMKNLSLIQGGFTNTGTISSTNNAINAINGSVIAGGFYNTSLIQGQQSGVVLAGSTISGGLSNTGSIVGLNGMAISLSSGSLLSDSLTNDGGYITGINNAGSMSGIQNNTGVIANGINNTGTISDLALPVKMYRGTLTGGFTNSGLIQATNSFAGVEFYASAVTGGFDNLGGTILGGLGGSAAFALHSGTTINGVVSNTGLISGQKGLSLTASFITGGVTNSGSIVGTSGAGVVVAVNTTLTGLNNTGYISSVSNAGFIANISNLGGTISGGVTNAGLIYNASGTGITASGSTLTVFNDSTGTIAGLFGGDINISNSGLIALQTMAGGTISAGTSLSAAITGNYVQATAGTLQIGVNGISGSGTIAGNYSTLTVGGTATFAANSKINVSMSSTTSAVQGQTLAGVVTASSLSSNGFTITDNSALVDFEYSTTSGVLSLLAVAPSTVACGTVSSSIQGPCLMAFNAPNVLVTGLGTISGGSTGIRVLSGVIAGGIVNQGSVIGSAYGVLVNQGATTITGGLSNAGLIQASSTLAGAGVLMNATSLAGGLNNASTGTISGYTGLMVASGSSLSGGLTNAGLITGLPRRGIQIAGSVLSGGVANNGGTITGRSGLLLNQSSLSGGLVNSGLINGLNAAGVALNSSSLSNGLNNVSAGTISGALVGLNLTNSTLSGGLTNAGLITGTLAGVSLALSSLQNGLSNTAGTISASVTGLMVSQSSLSGGLTNTGLITGLSGAGINLTASGLTGVVLNASTGTIAGVTHGLQLNSSVLNGSLTNTGLITGTSFAGVFVLNSSLSGSIANAGGTMSGGAQGLRVNASTLSGVVNSGLMYGSITGFALVGSNVSSGINNQSGGSIGGVYTGVYVTASQISGGINNASNATISATIGTGLALIGGSTLNGGITNSGLITSQVTNGLALGSAFVSGGLANNTNATISGAFSGLVINLSSITGGLTNSGFITGSSATGIAIVGGSTINGGLNNLALATISGGQTGLSISGNSLLNGGLTNAGLITGGTYAINAPSLTSIVSNGANAQFVGTVSASNASLNITSGTLTGANGLNVSAVSVAGGAQLNLVTSTASSISGGITAPNGVTNSGVVNVGMAAATITGNYVQAASGRLQVGAFNSANHGSLNVTGLAAFAPNASIQMLTITGSTFANGSTLAGVINAGSLSATSFNVSTTSVLVNFTANVVGNSVNVVAQSAGGGSAIQNAVAATGNTAAIGAANTLGTVFNSFLAGSPTYSSMNPVMASLANMTSNQQVSNAVSSTLPVLSADTPVNTLAVLTSINQSIEARTQQLRGVSTGQDILGNNSVWMKPFGSRTNQGNENGAYGFKANTGGVIFGADTMPTDSLRLGGAFAWGNSSATSNMSTTQTQSTNMYQFIGYGGYALTDTVNLNFQGNGGWNSNSTNRNIQFMNTSATANYNSAVWHAGVGVDRPVYASETTTFIPSARFDYTWIKNQSYSENGAAYGMNLNVGSQTYQTSVLGVDGKIIQKLSDHNTVNANLGVGYNFSPTQTAVAASYQGASALQFTTTGVNPSAVMGRAGVGYTYKINQAVDVGIRYDIDFQNQYTNQTATAKAKWMF